MTRDRTGRAAVPPVAEPSSPQIPAQGGRAPGGSAQSESAQSESADSEEPATLRLQEDGTVRLRWRQGIVVTADAARKAVAAVEVICAGQRRPLLVDMAAAKSVEREARGVSALPGAPSRIALLGASPVDKVIANFILGVSSVPVPTRFFTSESEAVTWLLSG